MEQYKFKLFLTEGAQTFLESLPYDAKVNISYNIRRVLAGERNNELFKKLENSDGIWEFRTLYRKIAYRLFCLLGYRTKHFDCCHSRHHKENPKNSTKGNSQG